MTIFLRLHVVLGKIFDFSILKLNLLSLTYFKYPFDILSVFKGSFRFSVKTIWINSTFCKTVQFITVYHFYINLSANTKIFIGIAVQIGNFKQHSFMLDRKSVV